MRWLESFTLLCLIWTLAVGSWLLLVWWGDLSALWLWPPLSVVLGYLTGLSWRRVRGLPWLAVGSVVLGFGLLVLGEGDDLWKECPPGEEGEYCELGQGLVWATGALALAVMAAIVGGMIMSWRSWKGGLKD